MLYFHVKKAMASGKEISDYVKKPFEIQTEYRQEVLWTQWQIASYKEP